MAATLILPFLAMTAVVTAAPGGLREPPRQNHTVDEAEASASVNDLAAEATRCHGAFMNAVENMAPGCLAQCESRGVCGAVSKAIRAYLPRHSKHAVEKVVCAHQNSFACLLEDPHKAKCQELITKGPAFGLPGSPNPAEIYQRCR